jgi:hypothetical protein
MACASAVDAYLLRMGDRREAEDFDGVRAPHVATGKIVEQRGEEPARRLYAAFAEYDARFFSGKLGSPLVLITQAQSTRTHGDYVPRDILGLESRIRIAPAAVRRGERFALDVLLHEMIHAWQHELARDLETGYRGHGPAFAAECNRIGAQLGLPPVGVKGRGGLPDCAHWPMCVRPEGYYPGLYRKPTRGRVAGRRAFLPGPADFKGGASSRGFDVMRGWLRGLDAPILRLLRDEIDRLLAEAD